MKKMFLILGCVTSTTIFSGYIFKINKYESNVLININSSLDKIRLSTKSLQNIKLNIGSSFFYKSEGINFSPKIINIISTGEECEILLQKEHFNTSNKAKTINYLVKTVNFWENLFNTGGD